MYVDGGEEATGHLGAVMSLCESGLGNVGVVTFCLWGLRLYWRG